MEKLSIIVPIYNVRKYLQECVESLIKQDYHNCEIILVDDGSTDGSSSLCDGLAKLDGRICVIHQANGGLSAARNAGLKKASGQYIGFIDSDDYVASDMFSSLIKAIENTGASVAICNFEVFNKKYRYKSKKYGNRVIEFNQDNQVPFYDAALDSSCNRVFRADAIRCNNLFFEDKSIVAQEDFWFQMRLFSHINRIVTIEECKYYYRERGSSITKSHSDGDITNRNLRFFTLTQAYIQKNSNRDVKQFLSFLLLNLFSQSVSHVSSVSPNSILKIVSQFELVPEFFESISSDSILSIVKGKSLRDKYTRISFSLLRNGFKLTYAFLETVRLKRVRSGSRRELYYE